MAKYIVLVPELGMQYEFDENQFIAFESYDEKGKKHRIYGRVTQTFITDETVIAMLRSGMYNIITDLTNEEKKLIYEKCD